ncbi:hypothetical protein J6O48_08700 [bacterium]|nr:hypothetical protein [bacterium]
MAFGDLTARKFNTNSYVGSPDFGKWTKMGFNPTKNIALINPQQKEQAPLEVDRSEGFKVVS